MDGSYPVLEFWAYTFLASSILFFLVIFFVPILLVKRKLSNVSVLSGNKPVHGMWSGIFFDFKNFEIAATNLLRTKAYKFDQISVFEYWRSEGESKKYWVIIRPNQHNLPTIKITLFTENQMDKCIAAWTEMNALWILENDQALDKTLEKEVLSSSNEKDIIREALKRALAARLDKNSLQIKKIGKRPLHDHINYIFNNIKDIIGRAWKRGDNLLITDALFHFLGKNDDEFNSPGYTWDTLKTEVTRVKQSIKID